MLLRILTDNPGQPFTQNFDTNFVSTVKSLLRDGKDQSVQQIMRETLDYFEVEKVAADDKLGPLIQMWRKEKSKSARFNQGPAVSHGMSDVYVPQETHSSQYPQYAGGQQHHQSRQSRPPRGLPPQDELAARIEEAKTTARLLIQTVQSTPQSELVDNELVKEFSERARSAHKSIQAYMNCENPSPDEDTMLTLIETNDQLNVAMSKHQRSMLQARKAAGMPSPQPPPGQERDSYIPAHTQGQNVYSNFSNQAPSQAPQAQQVQHANHGPYSSSPPRQDNGFSPVSPPSHAPTLPTRHREEENFAPPPGPPPNCMSAQAPSQPPPPQRQSTIEGEDAYSAQSPPRARKPLESQAASQPLASPTSAAAYGVPENPFADDSDTAAPPQQNSYSMLDRASHYIKSSSPTENHNEIDNLDTRPGAYQPTQSYTHRQDSSMNNLTMHGSSPPPAEEQRS